MISNISSLINISDKKFFTVPFPKEDELLSSWIVRVALAHDTLPWTFCNLHFPEHKNTVFARDLDIWASKDFLEKLAYKSNIEYSKLLEMTLRSYEGYITKEIRSCTFNLNISPLINRGRVNRGFGQKYCPLCLKEDEQPYFRKYWRLSFYNVCLKHKTILLDRCKNCNKPISLYKFKNERGYQYCWNCHVKLSENKTKYSTDEQFINTKRFINIVDSNCVIYRGNEINSLEFFLIYNELRRIIRKQYMQNLNPHSHTIKIEDNLKLINMFWVVFYNMNI